MLFLVGLLAVNLVSAEKFVFDYSEKGGLLEIFYSTYNSFVAGNEAECMALEESCILYPPTILAPQPLYAYYIGDCQWNDISNRCGCDTYTADEPLFNQNCGSFINEQIDSGICLDAQYGDKLCLLDGRQGEFLGCYYGLFQNLGTCEVIDPGVSFCPTNRIGDNVCYEQNSLYCNEKAIYVLNENCGELGCNYDTGLCNTKIAPPPTDVQTKSIWSFFSSIWNWLINLLFGGGN